MTTPSAPPEDANSSENDGGRLLDLPDLPPHQLRLMRILLRYRELTYVELRQHLADLPEAERLTVAEIDAALQALTQHNWVKRQTGNLQNVDVFQANVRRQNPREALVTVQRKRATLPTNLWDKLDKK